MKGQPEPFEQQGPLETVAQYGQRIVLHVARTHETALFSVNELELALSQANMFYTREMDPRTVAIVTYAKHLVCSILAARAKEGPADPIPVPAVEPSAYRPDVGPMAKLEPALIVRPPAGSLASIDF